MTPEKAYNYLKRNKKQDKELDYDSLFFLPITELYTEIYRTIMYSTPFLESIILKDPEYIYEYSFMVKGRWLEGENILLSLKNPRWIYKYAKDVIKDRWEEGEKALLEGKDPEWIYWYAKWVIKGKWLEGESILLECKDPEWIYYYALNVMEDRWPEAESIILESRYCKDYKEYFNIP